MQWAYTRAPLCGRYLELWIMLHHRLCACPPQQFSWVWWLVVCREELDVGMTQLRQIRMGHRLFTRLSVVVGSGASLSLCNEKRDPFTAVMRRAWPPKVSATKFAQGVRKLCEESSNRNVVSREALCQDLRRVVAAFRLGWLGNAQRRTTQNIREHREMILEFRRPSATAAEVDPELLLAAVQTYVHWYTAQSEVLRQFAARNDAALPPNFFTMLVQCVKGDPKLKRAVFEDELVTEDVAASYVASIDHTVTQVLDTRVANAEAEVMSDVNMAVREGGTVLFMERRLRLSESTVQLLLELVQAHYAQVSIKSHFKTWFASLLQTAQKGSNLGAHVDRLALILFLRQWDARQLVYTVPTPWAWVTNVATEFYRRERCDDVTVSPLCDVFMYCPTCLRICSICMPAIGSPFDVTSSHGRHHRRRKPRQSKRRRRRGGGGSGEAATADESPAPPTMCIPGAGFQDAVINVDTGRYTCMSRKTGSLAKQCRRTELCMVHLADKLLVYAGRVFQLCPQPHCAALMELEPSVTMYNAHGPACRNCTYGFANAPEPEPEEEDEVVVPAPGSFADVLRLLEEDAWQAHAEAEALARNEKLFDDND